MSPNFQFKTECATFMQEKDGTRHGGTEVEDLSTQALDAETIVPPHMVRLPFGSWGVWRRMGLRSTGFPASQVLRLAAPECAAAADQLDALEQDWKQARAEALSALQAHLKEAGQEGRASLNKLIKRVRKGLPIEPPVMGQATAVALDAYLAAHARIETGRADFRRSFERASERVSQEILMIARDSRFREAVTWQNRHALHGSIAALLQMSPEAGQRSAERRKREALVANYLQRYCVKNDSIGFFGPIGWASLNPDGEPLTVQPGPDLLAARHVYLEAWCVDALTETLMRNKALRRWIAPRRMPFVYAEGATFHLPYKNAQTLDAEHAFIFNACDGNTTAKQIADMAIADASLKLESEDGVYRLLEILSDMGLISWTLALPLPFELYPEQTLRRFCTRIGEESLRQHALRMLDELEDARRAVAEAAGDADRLDRALGDMEATFTRLTGKAATRSHGQMYASRTLLYEDCRRDVEVELGAEHLEWLGAPLSLLLDSARWFTYEAAARYREAFHEIYAGLSDRSSSKEVNAIEFWTRAQPLLFDAKRRVADTVLPEFQKRWANILSVPPEQSRVEYRTEALRPLVEASFDVPEAGWKYARYHSPDVMLAARDVEAIKRGDFQYVLGELHLGGHTMANWAFMAQHPSPEEFIRATELDLPDPSVILVTPKYWPGVTVRTSTALITPKDYFLEYSLDTAYAPPSRTLTIGSLVLEEREGVLLIRTRDRRLEFDLIELLGGTLSGVIINFFQMLGRQRHTPRVTIGRLVVARESWRFAPSELEFAEMTDESERFAAARRWARAYNMPRFVFAKTPVEVKPFFVDFESPVYVDIFSKMVRRTLNVKELDPMLTMPQDPVITVSEMLPGLEQMWLFDAEGQRYASEFRLVVVDLKRTAKKS
jgi:hypothetical protein